MDAATLSEQATLERFDAKQDRVARDFGYGDTIGALGITKDCLVPLKDYIHSKIEGTSKPIMGRPSVEAEVLSLVKPLPVELLALATLTGALQIVAESGKEIVACEAIGKAVHAEVWRAGLLEHDPELAAKVERAVKRRHGSLEYRKQAARSIAARAGFKAVRWSHKQTLTVGRIFLDYLLQALPDVFTLELEEGKPEDTPKLLGITEGALSTAEAAVEQAVRAGAVFKPMTQEPKPWTGWFDGGFWDARSRFKRSVVRTPYKETAAVVKAAISSGTMQPQLDAINKLQAVAWTINERVLGVLKWAYGNNVPVKGLPPLTNLPLPEKAAEWDAMSDDAKRLWKRKASQVKAYNRSFVSNRMLMKHDLETADYLAEAGRFWTPMNCDWRGRIYSIPHFNFQRDDRVRGLFLFADGKPIGEEGLYWLKVHVANCGDFDKVSKQSIEERVKWTDENLRRIEQMTWCPTKELWWSKADKPFLFLAACFELTSALAASNPSGYVTRIPVSFDGSCSGLQHLSAMTRDEKTAAMVNLLPGAKPQDVYQIVADRVRETVLADLEAAGTAQASLAKLWTDFKIDRKLVKRNVMTYSYSSKKFGMAQQLMEDLMRPLEFAVLEGEYETHPFGEDGGRAAAKYLAGITYDAITSLVRKPAEAMVMLQKTARALAHEGKPVTWTTPLGLPWVNRYHHVSVKRLSLWLHDVRVRLQYGEEGHEPEVDKEKSANGVAPNFVHACDAAHLLMVANASACEDITQLATVHDSFGCLARDAPRFRQIIREQFVKLYEDNDVLAQVLGQAKHDLTVHNQQRLPEVPQCGRLNLKEVLNAEYAFA